MLGVYGVGGGGRTTYVLTQRICNGHRDLEGDVVYLQTSSSLITWRKGRGLICTLIGIGV